MEKTVQDHVYDALVEVLGIEREQIKPETHLRDDLAMDALDLDDLSDDLEDRLSVIIDDDVDQNNTVSDLVAYVSKLDREAEDA